MKPILLLQYCLGVFGLLCCVTACTRPRQMQVDTDNITYRPALNPASAAATFYQSNSDWDNAYLAWQTAHARIEPCLNQGRLAFLEAHRKTVMALEALFRIASATPDTKSPYLANYQNLLDLYETDTPTRMLLYRCQALATSIQDHFAQTDYSGGHSIGRPANK